ncbi:MAG: SDR family NAD(P)-dependent oxidoreductase [Lachnospiraceae bacterium]|nr:SDR family NAD(P)-dependent oxidoreductase [Lachnospiraceae bacterium]
MKKHAIITGASRGIGKAIAQTFAQNGYDLTLTCINNRDKLSALAEEIEKNHGISVNTFTGDLGKYENTVSLFKEIRDVDVLINNAGISYFGLLQDMEPKDWENVISTNLNSVFYCSKLAIPHMLHKKSGKILNISSIWGNLGASMEVAYSASKGGVNAFTRALAKELAPSNIQVNAIACGMMDTDMNSIFTPEETADIISEIPANRIGRPEEAAHLALQICTGNTYLTGQIITLDGGFT